MSVSDDFYIGIPTREEVIHWCKHIHYAHRVPQIIYKFGLFRKTNKRLVGISVFGLSANYAEMMAWRPYNMLELNRLCVEDELPKNTLSWFLMQSIALLPQPTPIISYADNGMGHYGYIYQATNWIYTGVGGEGCDVIILKDGTERHQRNKEDIDPELIDRIEKTSPKSRYYYLHGNKTQVKDMKRMLLERWDILPYPKGEPKRYGVEKQTIIQSRLCFDEESI